MYLLEKNFESATRQELELLKKYFYSQNYESSAHTYSSFFMWAKQYNASWEIINGYLWITSSYEENGKEYFYATMPLSIDGFDRMKDLADSVKKIKEKFDNMNQRLIIGQVPTKFKKILFEACQGKCEIYDDRNNYDYVYLREKLATLSGRALHKKKNHLNFFLKNYDYEVKILGKESIDEIYSLAEEINSEKEAASDLDELNLYKELRAIDTALRDGNLVNNIDYKPDKCSADYMVLGVKISGKLQAFTIAAKVAEDEVIVHIEKAGKDYRGLYQIINWELAKKLPSKVIRVNREEDMGIENLRQAKESYKPYKMYEKYIFKF